MSMLGIYPYIYKELAYDPIADLTPVWLGASFDFGFAVGPAVPASIRSMGELLEHVPYRGTQPAILDMVGGQIQAVSGPVGESTQHLAAGKCRLLASTGSVRSKFAPGVPTLLEQGFTDMALNEWFGFYLPGNASADVVQRANTALRAADPRDRIQCRLLNSRRCTARPRGQGSFPWGLARPIPGPGPHGPRA